MGLPININNLIQGDTVERSRIDYKKGFDQIGILHSMCAFANDYDNIGGGYIIVGIEEKDGLPQLPPLGLQINQIDSYQKKIVELGNLIIHSYLPILEPAIFQGKHILIIWCPSSDNRPHKAPSNLGKKTKKDYRYYIRVGSTTVQANPDQERKLIELSAKIPFDDRTNNGASINDLDRDLINEYLVAIGSDLANKSNELSLQDLAHKMQLAKGPQEDLHPKNIGLMMFNQKPEEFFPGAQTDVVIYEDSAGKTFTEKSFNGPVHKQAKAVLEYLQINVIKEKIRKIRSQAEAIRIYNYPYLAIEEIVINAIYHRSYEDRRQIEISIYQDRMEVLSYPGPLPPINNKVLKQYKITARDYRNRRLGDFLKELNLAEARATGIPTARDEMKENGSSEPKFETDKENNYFLATLPIHPAFERIKLDDYKTEILKNALSPISRSELLATVGLSSHYDNFLRHIKPLIDADLLEYTIPGVPKSRKQRYIITPEGRERLS